MQFSIQTTGIVLLSFQLLQSVHGHPTSQSADEVLTSVDARDENGTVTDQFSCGDFFENGTAVQCGDVVSRDITEDAQAVYTRTMLQSAIDAVESVVTRDGNGTVTDGYDCGDLFPNGTVVTCGDAVRRDVSEDAEAVYSRSLLQNAVDAMKLVLARDGNGTETDQYTCGDLFPNGTVVEC